MAIAKRRLGSYSYEEAPIKEDIQEPRKSTFTALVPDERRHSLLKYIEGKPWNVIYYKQLLNENNPGDSFDPDQGDLSQPYLELNNVVLKVQSDLSHDTDTSDENTVLTGEAILPNGIIPYIGDIFIANVDTGEDALFVVTDRRRLSHRKGSLRSIEYTLYAYLNKEPDLLDKIKKRVNESLYYDRYLDSQHRNVLITRKEKDHIDRLRTFMYDSQQYYFQSFLQYSSGSVAIPGIDLMVIDPILHDFIRKTVDTSKHRTFNSWTYTPVSVDYRRGTILEAIRTRRKPNNNMFERLCGFIPEYAFPERSVFNSFGFSGISYALHPLKPNRTMVSNSKFVMADESQYEPRNETNYNNRTIYVTEVMGTTGSVEMEILPTLFEDDYYIVTKRFYDYLDDSTKTEDLSFLEVVIFRYINGEMVALEDLDIIISEWTNWSSLEQFYFLPVLWLIIKSTLGIV